MLTIIFYQCKLKATSLEVRSHSKLILIRTEVKYSSFTFSFLDLSFKEQQELKEIMKLSSGYFHKTLHTPPFQKKRRCHQFSVLLRNHSQGSNESRISTLLRGSALGLSRQALIITAKHIQLYILTQIYLMGLWKMELKDCSFTQHDGLTFTLGNKMPVCILLMSTAACIKSDLS